MKLLALLSLALVGCGMPAPPASGLAGSDPDASIALPPPDDDEDVAVDAAPRADAEPRSRVLTQTTSDQIEPLISISCSDDDGFNLENSYYRVFDLAALGITSSFHVTEVGVAVETAMGGGDATQPIDVQLHTLTGDLQTDNLQSLATETQEVIDRVGGRLEFAFDATVPAGGKLAVEVHLPDGRDDGNSFYIGANNDGESAPGYIRAPDCGTDQPTTLADIGFPDVDILIDVSGD